MLRTLHSRAKHEFIKPRGYRSRHSAIPNGLWVAYFTVEMRCRERSHFCPTGVNAGSIPFVLSVERCLEDCIDGCRRRWCSLWRLSPSEQIQSKLHGVG